MRSSIMLYLFITLVLISCDKKNVQKKENAPPPHSASVINEKSVWHDDLANKCASYETRDICLIKEIEKSGSIEALKAVQYLNKTREMGYVYSFRKEGPIGIAEIEYPFRANTNTTTLLIPPAGKPIYTEDIYDDLLTSKVWLDFKKQHPYSNIQDSAVLMKTEKNNDDIEFIFSFRVGTCHGCEETARVYISYKFTHEGVFIKNNILYVKISS
ncbi:hypothetical protein CKC_05135 [Candidatus Liberibacter solanacearum CLso-ZC1]|uniref:Lipoprotein n=1 Tax=Liberibacter solanacearum (strain CLso-ZC1) TaxID=658172 RepID=E4UDU5_LIBSC|nr:hypothetical protein [Candidatus Liberibacter solanacearum]ADR52773.1 hypothetical protein CKC_05135 [Candidatus Liberibacter solanacearum CLso-ZC1]